MSKSTDSYQRSLSTCHTAQLSACELEGPSGNAALNGVRVWVEAI